MLESLTKQTVLPKKVIVVNDNSTDKTSEIISEFSNKYNWIKTKDISSSTDHTPGSKVIKAFNSGLEMLDNSYDVICKFDADIILPDDYLEKIITLFKSDEKIGITGGLAFIERGDKWVYESIASKEHVRGPFKAYRKSCFEDIGGLKESIGWDTVDTLLAKYYGWKVKTDKNLHVKHLKPTGKIYNKKSKFSFGEGLYKMRMGFTLSFLSALKSCLNKRSLSYFVNTIRGYIKAKLNNKQYIVTKEQGKFIRKLRWDNILKSFF